MDAVPPYPVDPQFEEVAEPPPRPRFLHGFRIGWGYASGMEDHLASPHLFVLGDELTHRIIGGDWLDVIVVENVLASGMNQSVILPSANGLLGFEIAEQLQVGAGVNASPWDPDGKLVHMVGAVGYTPQVGTLHVPLHAYWIPDVDGQWRFGLTTGVNW